MSYKKGKDGKIKNIEQLDSVENRGIEIRYKCNTPKIILVKDDKIWTWDCDDLDKPEDFTGW